MLDKRVYGIMALATLCLAPVFAEGPTFIPDATFKGSTLKGWHVLGQADWRAQNGEIAGTAKSSGGGWLVLDRSYQDVELFANFRCSGGCRTGVLFRAEKTADGGMKGIYLSLNEGDVAWYRVTVGADGRELQREPLRSANENGPGAAGRVRGGRGGGRNVDGISLDPNIHLPLAPPKPGLHSGEWNEVEIFFDPEIQLWLNDVAVRELAVPVPDNEGTNYGPLALYVGGTGEVRFKDVAYKNLAFRLAPAEKVSSNFRMQRLNEFDYAWSAAAADFNRDGILDIVAGPFIYFGPELYEIAGDLPGARRQPVAANTRASACNSTPPISPATAGRTCCAPTSANPSSFMSIRKGESRRWDKYQVVPAGPQRDIDRSGHRWRRKTRAGLHGRQTTCVMPSPTRPIRPGRGWCTTFPSKDRSPLTASAWAISTATGAWTSSTCIGWWEQPAAGSQQEPWTYPSAGFRPLGALRAGRRLMAYMTSTATV